jgi:KUP system potassium uptake protein
MVGFFVLGSVFLTVTGAEALYADMGHFGRWPIQSAWLFLALPCLALNYLGQGAMALHALGHAGALAHGLPDADWFFLSAPPELRLPLVVLATIATIIASQAVITGAYSLSQQAIQLGLLPRLDVRRTSETQTGQIFLPQINNMLLIGVLLLVAMFQSSDKLSHAYGLAVTGTMLVTTSLAYIVVRRMWRWGPLRTALLIGPLLAMDLTFLTANALKFLSGGWVPVLIGLALSLVMLTWHRGTQLLFDKTRRDSVPLRDLADILKQRAPHRVAGAAVFLTSDPDVAPVALMHNLKHNKVLHEKNIILSVSTAETPRVRDDSRIKIEPVSADFTKVTITYGFMESPNLPRALALLRRQGLKLDIMTTSFFLGRRSVVPAVQSGMPLWQDKLFIFLMKNATNPTDFFNIPPGRVVEMGTQVTV